jgi:thiol-disulfide isomerase/thioredoxin
MQAMANAVDVELSSGSVVPVHQYGPDDQDRLLWIPSEFGLGEHNPRSLELATGIATQGFEVWMADIHSAWFLPPGRTSLTEVPVEDVVELIARSVPSDPERRLFILTAERGSILSLMAINRWLQEGGDRNRLAGIYLLHPNLMNNTPEPGQPVIYHDVIEYAAMPVYILQPGSSSKVWYLDSVVNRLQSGGAQVFTQIIPGVADGYQTRPEATDEEVAASKELPRHIARAKAMLTASQWADAKTDYAISDWTLNPLSARLKPYSGDPTPSELDLTDLDGRRYDLADYRGKVVLINFWATWCPPCVEEIPSLNRLGERLKGEDFELISVDIKEEVSVVETFLEQVPANYPVLMDVEGKTVLPWKLRAFPTTYILDKKGKIRLAFFGGLLWDSDPVVAEIIRLMEEEG